MLHELGHTQTEPTPIYVDNSAVVDLMKTEKRLGNSKHYNRLAWLRHQVKEKIVELILISTTQQAADYLTKVLPRAQFEHCRDLSGLTCSSMAKLEAGG